MATEYFWMGRGGRWVALLAAGSAWMAGCTDEDQCTPERKATCEKQNTACQTFACVPDTGTCKPTDKPDKTACDDGDKCTKDACDKKDGCKFDAKAMEGVACDDKTACTQNEACTNGACVPPAPAKSCDDGNDCTTEDCDPLTGKCNGFNKKTGTACDDGDKCTSESLCDTAKCVG
jgi:hypothetical protein